MLTHHLETLAEFSNVFYQEDNKNKEIKALKQRIAQLEKTNQVLMEQIEHLTDKQGNEFAMFQQALRLERESLETKKYQQQMQREKQAAEEASAAKSRFLAIMSHELRTPMNAIIGYSDILYEELEDSELEWLGDLNKIRISAKQLLCLIDDILDYSKIEAGKMNVYAENIDLPGLLNELSVTVESLATSKNNSFNINSPPNLVPVYTDMGKLRQILLNLLSNACKFTEHGSITLHISQQYQNDELCTVFQVVDTGIGITREQQKKLFQPFTQADESTTRNYGGTGLGLALSQQLSSILQGRIDLQSEVGKGSCFTVFLPHYRGSDD